MSEFYRAIPEVLQEWIDTLKIWGEDQRKFIDTNLFRIEIPETLYNQLSDGFF